MDGEIVDFSPDINRGGILGEDKRRYGFVVTDWRSAGEPQPGEAVRFVAEADQATQIYRLPPPYVRPLTPGEAIDAVYSIALGRADDKDPFGAAVQWTSFIPPVLIVLALQGAQILLSVGLPIDWHKATFFIAALVLLFLAGGILFMLAVTLGIVALLGRMMGSHGRIAAGALSYIWMQTALLQPAVFLLRMTVGPRDPTLIVVLAAVGMVAVVIGAGRVVKSGFRLDSVGGGAFVVVAGGIISYLIDGVLSAL
jgi:hypothetical protein